MARFKGTFGGMRTNTIKVSKAQEREMAIQLLQSCNPYMTRADAEAALAKDDGDRVAFTTNFKHQLPTRVDRKVARDAEKEAQWRACVKAVDARDHRICRETGKKTNPDDIGLIRGHRHHIVYRSAGGQDTPENVITLSWQSHNDEHKGRLKIEVLNRELGANGPVEFWRLNDDGDWYLSKRELDVHHVEHD